jgi:hypothetical protein
MAYAFDVLPETDRTELIEWINTKPRNQQTDESIVEKLNQCGAGLYMLAEVEKQFNLGMIALEMASPSSPAGERLETLMDELKMD